MDSPKNQDQQHFEFAGQTQDRLQVSGEHAPFQAEEQKLKAIRNLSYEKEELKTKLGNTFARNSKEQNDDELGKVLKKNKAGMSVATWDTNQSKHVVDRQFNFTGSQQTIPAKGIHQSSKPIHEGEQADADYQMMSPQQMQVKVQKNFYKGEKDLLSSYNSMEKQMKYSSGSRLYQSSPKKKHKLKTELPKQPYVLQKDPPQPPSKIPLEAQGKTIDAALPPSRQQNFRSEGRSQAASNQKTEFGVTIQSTGYFSHHKNSHSLKYDPMINYQYKQQPVDSKIHRYYAPFQFKQVIIEFDKKKGDSDHRQFQEDQDFEEFLKEQRVKDEKQKSRNDHKLKLSSKNTTQLKLKTQGSSVKDAEKFKNQTVSNNIRGSPSKGESSNHEYRVDVQFKDKQNYQRPSTGNEQIVDGLGQKSFFSGKFYQDSIEGTNRMETIKYQQNDYHITHIERSGGSQPTHQTRAVQHSNTFDPHERIITVPKLESAHSKPDSEDYKFIPQRILVNQSNQIDKYNTTEEAESFQNIMIHHQPRWQKGTPKQQRTQRTSLQIEQLRRHQEAAFQKQMIEYDLHKMIDQKRNAMPAPRFNLVRPKTMFRDPKVRRNLCSPSNPGEVKVNNTIGRDLPVKQKKKVRSKQSEGFSKGTLPIGTRGNSTHFNKSKLDASSNEQYKYPSILDQYSGTNNLNRNPSQMSDFNRRLIPNSILSPQSNQTTGMIDQNIVEKLMDNTQHLIETLQQFDRENLVDVSGPISPVMCQSPKNFTMVARHNDQHDLVHVIPTQFELKESPSGKKRQPVTDTLKRNVKRGKKGIGTKVLLNTYSDRTYHKNNTEKFKQSQDTDTAEVNHFTHEIISNTKNATSYTNIQQPNVIQINHHLKEDENVVFDYQENSIELAEAHNNRMQPIQQSSNSNQNTAGFQKSPKQASQLANSRSQQISSQQKSQMYKSIESENKQQNIKSFIKFHLENQDRPGSRQTINQNFSSNVMSFQENNWQGNLQPILDPVAENKPEEIYYQRIDQAAERQEEGFIYNEKKKSLVGGQSSNENVATPKNEDLTRDLSPIAQYPTVIKVVKQGQGEDAKRQPSNQQPMSELEKMRQAALAQYDQLTYDEELGLFLTPVDEALLQSTIKLTMEQSKIFFRNPSVDLKLKNIKRKMQATTTKGIVSSVIERHTSKSRADLNRTLSPTRSNSIDLKIKIMTGKQDSAIPNRKPRSANPFFRLRGKRQIKSIDNAIFNVQSNTMSAGDQMTKKEQITSLDKVKQSPVSPVSSKGEAEPKKPSKINVKQLFEKAEVKQRKLSKQIYKKEMRNLSASPERKSVSNLRQFKKKFKRNNKTVMHGSHTFQDLSTFKRQKTMSNLSECDFHRQISHDNITKYLTMKSEKGKELEKELDKLLLDLQQKPKPKSIEQKKLEEIQKDIRIMNQIALRLISSKDQQPVLSKEDPQIIDVVPNVPMQFLCKIKDTPSPVKLLIKYLDLNKKVDLQVFYTFSDKGLTTSMELGQSSSQAKPNAGKKTKFFNPKVIVIEASKDTVHEPQQIEDPAKKKAPKKNFGGKFTENNLFFIFTSMTGCSIQVKLETTKSIQIKKQKQLMNHKAEVQRLQEEIESKFTVEDPYYKEMRMQEVERRRKAREWHLEQRKRRLEKTLQDPETGQPSNK